MSCEELRGSYELYALGVLEDPDKEELREHLNRRCEVCLKGLQQARETVAMLAEGVPPVAPSPRLRQRILASVGVEQKQRWWLTPMWVGVSLTCLVAAVYFYGRERAVAIHLVRSQTESREVKIQMARLAEALAILNLPETRQVTFGEGQPTPPRGRVFVNPTQGVLLLASNLPPAPAGRTYEMWIIPKGGKPVPAGLFQSDSGGSALHLQRGPVDLASTGAVAVTLEAEGGAPQPTSTPLIVAAL